MRPRTSLNLAGFVLLISVVVAHRSFAAPGDVDASFNAGPVVNTPAYSTHVKVQSDGKVVIGGAFTSINGIPRNRIARLNTDGSVDGLFLNAMEGANGPVFCVALQGNGQILIAGSFTSVNGVARNRMARLNADGSLDGTFLNGLSGLDDWVESIAIQPDGKILIGGFFTLVNGVTRNLVARLNFDGSLDGGFLNGLAGANNAVLSIARQSDGKILIGGAFSVVNGDSRNSIARLNDDGSVDQGFLNGLSGANAGINALALQSDGRILIGGSFNLVNGVTRNRLARLNSNGALDTSFLNGLAGANNFVYTLGLQSDGRMIVGGAFTSINGFPRNCVARLNGDGSVDDWFLHRLAGANETIGSVAVQADDKVLIAGDFSLINGVARSQVARLFLDYGPPRIEAAGMVNNQFSFILMGTPGDTFIVQASTNMANWISLSTNLLGSSPPVFSDPQTSSFARRFYRFRKS